MTGVIWQLADEILREGIMNIRNNLDGLQSILDLSSSSMSKIQQSTGSQVSKEQPANGDHATLSQAGKEALNSTRSSDVRSEKVAEIQAALAAGTYEVSPSAVAGKMVDSMLGRHPLITNE